jgi:hypothetical protein
LLYIVSQGDVRDLGKKTAKRFVTHFPTFPPIEISNFSQENNIVKGFTTIEIICDTTFNKTGNFEIKAC